LRDIEIGCRRNIDDEDGRVLGREGENQRREKNEFQKACWKSMKMHLSLVSRSMLDVRKKKKKKRRKKEA
jgi:hypothetical protein